MIRGLAATMVSLTLSGFPATGYAQVSAADKEAVRLAALDYLEAIYNVQPERIERSVHTTLVKRGFYKKDASTPYVEMPMTYEQLVKLAGNWNKDGKRDTSIKEVAVLDVLDQTAIAKVTASWGIDHMLLGKYDGRWKIVQILWQSHPPKATTSSSR
jgi:Putative lumazine-binding